MKELCLGTAILSENGHTAKKTARGWTVRTKSGSGFRPFISPPDAVVPGVPTNIAAVKNKKEAIRILTWLDAGAPDAE